MTTPNDALDFYPTPDSLAFDMVFSLREVKSGFTTYPKPILEPSAGDGALARSPSSRRAWIEIWAARPCSGRSSVALLAEGVD